MSERAPIYDLSTHAKILINEWKTLHELLTESIASAKAKTEAHESKLNSPLLSDTQINDALLGPLHDFFKQKLSAYAAVSRIRLQLTAATDEAMKNRSPKALPKNLEKITPAELDKIQNSLNELTQKHFAEWKAHLKEWNQQLLLALTANHIALSEIEIKEFNDREPLSELFNRFVDLHLETPTWEAVTAERYLQLKTHLAIHSYLSRNHQPHDTTEINKILKKLKKDFAQIAKEEKQFIENQKKETQPLIASL